MAEESSAPYNNEPATIRPTASSSEIVPRELRRRRRGRGPRWLRRFVRRFRAQLRLVPIIVISTIAILIAAFSILVTNASSELNESWDQLNRVLTSISGRSGTELTLQDFDRLQNSVTQLTIQLEAIEGRFAPARLLTGVNGDMNALFEMLAVGKQLAGATDDMLAGVEPALTFMVAGEENEAVAGGLTSGERLTELLEIGQPNFQRAQGNLQLAADQLASIDRSSVSGDILLTINEFSNYFETVQATNSVLLDLPDVLPVALGLGQPRNYLVLSQNNDELRPSGGYLSTYGYLVLRNGRVVDFDYNPTTTETPNPPPASFADQYPVPDWWLGYEQPVYAAWDGSWHADFVQTAAMAQAYYEAGNNPPGPIDGVLSIYISGFEGLLAALGPVEVPEYDLTVTAQNFRDLVYEIRSDGEGRLPHKRFVATIYQEIFQAWSRISEENTPQMLQAVLTGLQNKHILFYSSNPQVMNALRSLGWSGEQQSGSDHDYLMVVDANLGNKSNASVARSITYDVEITPDHRLRSRTSVAYDYPSAVAAFDPAVDPAAHGPLDYRNILQVYTPQGSRLLETNELGSVETVAMDAHTLFVSRVIVPFDAARRFQLSYETGELVEVTGAYQRYRLLVQKQPGARTNDLNVQVRLPQGSRILDSIPAADAVYDLDQPILDFRLTLDSDQWIEIIYRQ